MMSAEGQTIASIRAIMRKDREETIADPFGYLSGLPAGDSRLKWVLKINSGHPVLSLFHIGSYLARIGFIQPDGLIWIGTIYVDGESFPLEYGRPQPNKFHMARHLYGLAVQLLNSDYCDKVDGVK